MPKSSIPWTLLAQSWMCDIAHEVVLALVPCLDLLRYGHVGVVRQMRLRCKLDHRLRWLGLPSTRLIRIPVPFRALVPVVKRSWKLMLDNAHTARDISRWVLSRLSVYVGKQPKHLDYCNASKAQKIKFFLNSLKCLPRVFMMPFNAKVANSLIGDGMSVVASPKQNLLNMLGRLSH